MKKIIFLSIVVILAILFGAEIKRGFLTILIMTDALRPPEKAVMGKLIPSPVVKAVTVFSKGRGVRADLYIPKPQGRFTPLLLVHGVNPTGKDDPQIVVLAKDLAMAGFLVMVPDMEGMKRLRMRVSDIEDVIRSFLYLSNHRQAGPGGCMMGISYGAGPVLFAAADKRVSRRLRTVVSFGGYGDLRAVLMFVLTGHYDYAGQRGYQRPDESFRWAFMYRNLDLIRSIHDRALLKTIIEKRNLYELKEAAGLARRLGPEAMAVYDFISNREQGRFVALYEKLPLDMREYMEALSPVRVMKRTRAYFIIAHGVEDYSIPYTESLRLADAVGDPDRVHLAVLPQFMHTEPVEPSFGDIYRRYIVGGWRMFYSIYDLLGRRD